jgi:hypothetical protein
VDAFHRSFPIISTVSKSVIIKSMLIFFHSIILLDIAVGSRFAKHDRLPRSQNTCQLQRGLEKYPTPLEGMFRRTSEQVGALGRPLVCNTERPPPGS